MSLSFKVRAVCQCAAVWRKNIFLALRSDLSNLNPVTTPGNILVCFAVKEEAAPFRRLCPPRPTVAVLVHGIGAINAANQFNARLARNTPQLVLTCGFAGGLNPALKRNDLIYSADPNFPLAAALEKSGARSATFHCSRRIAVTAAEKAALRQSTGADAVEMESEIIRNLCHERGLPAATLRVISDAAGDDLPLDFNALATANLEMHFGKLALAIIKSPGKIGELLRFQKEINAAAETLARALVRIISAA